MMSEQTGPYLELEKAVLDTAKTDRERYAAVKALRAKLEEHDDFEVVYEEVIEDMEVEIRDQMQELDGWDELRQEAIDELEDEILLKVAERLEGEPEEDEDDED
jgi:hypothetical protein